MYYIDGATNINLVEKQLGENRQKIIWPFNKYDDHVASRQSHARLRNLYIYKIAGKKLVQENLFANFGPQILLIFLE